MKTWSYAPYQRLCCILCCFALMVSCNTPLDPPEVLQDRLFRLENILGTWQLKAASAVVGGGVIKIDDLFDPIKNPQAAQTICIKNSILDLRRGGVFEETADCYAANGGIDTEAGTYVHNGTPAKTTITLNYDNSSVIPQRVYTVEALKDNQLKMSFEAVQQGFTVTITYVYER